MLIHFSASSSLDCPSASRCFLDRNINDDESFTSILPGLVSLPVFKLLSRPFFSPPPFSLFLFSPPLSRFFFLSFFLLLLFLLLLFFSASFMRVSVTPTRLKTICRRKWQLKRRAMSAAKRREDRDTLRRMRPGRGARKGMDRENPAEWNPLTKFVVRLCGGRYGLANSRYGARDESELERRKRGKVV